MEDWSYQPARDLGLPMTRRWRSPRRESGLEESIVQGAWWRFVHLHLCCLHRLDVRGRENLPRELPFVLVANHASHLDALALSVAVPARLRRRVLPIAAGDTFFDTPVLAAYAAIFLNALPLWRHNAGRHALAELRQRLIDEPCAYILFPEGTRSRTGQMGSFKAGIGMMMAGADVPVIPCFIDGAARAFPPGARLPRPARIRVRIGAGLRFNDIPNTRQGWERIATETERAVRALGNLEKRS